MAYGAGMSLSPRQVSAHSLRSSLQAILEQSSYRETATRLRQHFAGFGGSPGRRGFWRSMPAAALAGNASQTMIVNGQ
jgi:hypothetical protein